MVTDRMITAGDVQYTPRQTKVAEITPSTILLIAGDYSVHSQAIRRTESHFENNQTASPEKIAEFYGRAIQAIKLKEAEDLFLAPLGLNTDSFLAQQKDMAAHFVSHLTDQMQGYRGEEVEALIVGGTGDRVDLYGVDSKGIISSHNDVGFAAIGSGAWHAKSRLMQMGYTKTVPFAPAAVSLFAAKKSAEIAPGVGWESDIKVVFNDHTEPLRPDVARQLNDLYHEYRPKADSLAVEYINKFQSYISAPSVQVADEEPKGLPGGDAQANERPAPPAAETPRSDKSGENGKREAG